MFKRTLCFFFISLSVFTCFSASAESGVSVFLTDIITEKNVLFETYLSVNTEVAAFVATLEFDQSKVEFRSAAALSENTELSVNNSEKGKVTLAFLNNQGTKGEVVKLTFKATTENAFISLSIEQVIDKNAGDIKPTSIKGADVNITSVPTDKSDNSKEAEDKTLPTASKANTGETKNTEKAEEVINITLPPQDSSDLLFIICISLGAVLISAVGITGFILGRKSNNKNRKN